MEGRRLLRVQQGIARATRCDRRTTRQAANAAARPAQPGAVHVDGHMCAPRHHKHDKLHKHTSEPHTAGFCSRLRGCARAPHLAPRRAGPAGEHVRPQVADERSAPARQPARGQRLAKTLIYPDRRPCPPRRPPAPATPCHGRPLPAGALPSSDPGPPPPRRRAHGRPPPRRASQRSPAAPVPELARSPGSPALLLESTESRRRPRRLAASASQPAAGSSPREPARAAGAWGRTRAACGGCGGGGAAAQAAGLPAASAGCSTGAAAAPPGSSRSKSSGLHDARDSRSGACADSRMKLHQLHMRIRPLRVAGQVVVGHRASD